MRSSHFLRKMNWIELNSHDFQWCVFTFSKVAMPALKVQASAAAAARNPKKAIRSPIKKKSKTSSKEKNKLDEMDISNLSDCIDEALRQTPQSSGCWNLKFIFPFWFIVSFRWLFSFSSDATTSSSSSTPVEPDRLAKIKRSKSTKTPTPRRTARKHSLPSVGLGVGSATDEAMVGARVGRI